MSGATPVKGIDAPSVSRWLGENVDGLVAPFRFALITGGHSNLTYEVRDAGGRRVVLRRPPLGAVLATAHDMGREHKIISGLWKTDVPVPEALALCQDESVNGAPFYVMDFVRGTVLATAHEARALQSDEASRRALGTAVVEVLACLHQVDPDAVGLGDLGRKEAYLDRQLKRWHKQWESSRTRELPSMGRAYQLLLERKPEQRYTGIVHGDYRLGNMLVQPDGSVAAVLDWELCTLGDTLADLGYVLNNWVQPGEEGPDVALAPTSAGGFLTREEFVTLYAERTRREVVDIDYYRAFQSWRSAAIVEGVLARYLKGVMGDPDADTNAFSTRVELLATRALDLIEAL